MPNPSIKDEKLYRDLRKQDDLKEKSACMSDAAAARDSPETRQRAWNVRLFEPGAKTKADQRARTGPAIGAPIVSVTNIRTIKNHPAPCQAHHTPWSRQTR